MRLLYLDEAGSDRSAPSLVVAGVLVHGDHEWPEVDRRMEAVLGKYVPDSDRLGFVFHATDIFHGSRYFDRRKPEWPEDRRVALLNDLASIIQDMHLPVLSGGYNKDGFGAHTPELTYSSPEEKGKLIHNMAAMDCLLAADRWLARFAPDELATVVHEDGTPAKQQIKNAVRVLRNAGYLEQFGVNQEVRAQFGLPLKRIIDTVHFADKPEARPLQLADLCAFILGRAAKDLKVPAYAFNVIWAHLKWMTGVPTVTPPARLGAEFLEGGEK